MSIANFGHDHFLVKAWREKTGYDSRKRFSSGLGGVVVALILGLGLTLVLNAVDAAFQTPQKNEPWIGTFFLCMTIAVGFFCGFIIYRPGEYLPLDQLNLQLCLKIYPETPEPYLHTLADIKLRALAQTLWITEGATGLDCHNNACYEAQRQARQAFSETFDFLKKCGLTAPDWKPYFTGLS